MGIGTCKIRFELPQKGLLKKYSLKLCSLVLFLIIKHIKDEPIK